MPEKPFPELRQKAAEQIIRNREGERRKPKSHYEVSRELKDYEGKLHGTKHFFQYVIDHPTLPKKILEIGIGEGRGFLALSQKYKEKLSFTGTALHRLPDSVVPDQVRLTSAEMLTGIENASIGGIYGLYSIPYAEPVLACRRMDKVLAPGGVIKTIFPHQSWEMIKMKSSEPFEEVWRKMGYDIAIEERNFLYDRFMVIIAIKPGGKKTVSAKKLLEKDGADYDKKIKK